MNDFTVHERRMPAAPVAHHATPQTPELNKALAAARAEIKNPRYDKFNPQYRNQFASHPTVIDAVMPALNKHGLTVLQDCVAGDDYVEVQTTIVHESGEEKSFRPWQIPLLVSKEGKVIRTKGELGAARTYACRTNLMTVLCIAGDEDMDANEEAPDPAISADQVAALEQLIEATKSNKAAYLKVLKVDSLEELPASKYEGAVKRLESKKAKKDATA